MQRKATDLFVELSQDAINCDTINGFNEYAKMTTSYAYRAIISLLDEGVIYRYNEQLILKKFDRLCFIRKNTDNTIRLIMDFSIKHIVNNLRPRDVRWIDDYFVLNQIVNGLIKTKK